VLALLCTTGCASGIRSTKGGPPEPVLLDPVEDAVVGTARPRFRFKAPPGADEIIVEVCRSAACGYMVGWWSAKGAGELVPDRDLPSTRLYVRLRALAGGKPLSM